MDQGYWAQEVRINEAMAYLSTNPNASIARITREYNVLVRKLQSSRPAAGKALIDEIKKTIYK